jgi:hypothetical protein
MTDISFQADRLHVLISFPAGPGADYRAGEHLAGTLGQTLHDEAACQRLAGFASKTLSYPSIRLLIEQTLRSCDPLFSLRTERVEQDNILLRLDMLKSDLLRSTLAKEADRHVEQINQSWLMRIIRWCGARLIDPKEVAAMDKEGDAQCHQQYLHEASSRLYILMLDAVALELIEAAGEAGRDAKLFLVCPGAPNPKVSINLDRVRQVVRPTQTLGRATLEA